MWLAEQVLAHAGTADFWWKSRLRLLCAGVLLLHMSCLNLSCAPRWVLAVSPRFFWPCVISAPPSDTLSLVRDSMGRGCKGALRRTLTCGSPLLLCLFG